MRDAISPSTFALMVMDMAQIVARDLPWKKTQDPYHIWISEIILQQTRVAQGTAYYLRFVERFPDVISLANSTQDEVIKMWEGLGYYSRARNLHGASQQVRDRFGGVFPSDFDDIISLRGVGPYTAAAIASFAFGQHYASIDGNAYRVVARVNGYADAIGTKTLVDNVAAFSAEAIKDVDPGRYNQAIMDLGSQICTPSSPSCDRCQLIDRCQAYLRGMTKELPTKKAKIKVRTRYFHYIFLRYPKNQTIIELREGSDIWKGMYQLPMIETEDCLAVLTISQVKELLSIDIKEAILPQYKQTQQLTHQKVYASFYIINCDEQAEIKKHQYLVDRKKVLTFAYPKIINDFFKIIKDDL